MSKTSDVHRYGNCFARGLELIKARDHSSRNGEQGLGGAECLSLKPCWEGSVPSTSTIVGKWSCSSIFTVGKSSKMKR